jgi:hypothetical protein
VEEDTVIVLAGVVVDWDDDVLATRTTDADDAKSERCGGGILIALVDPLEEEELKVLVDLEILTLWVLFPSRDDTKRVNPTRRPSLSRPHPFIVTLRKYSLHRRKKINK